MSLNRKARRQFEKSGSSNRAKVVGVATAGSVLATQASLMTPAAAVSNQVVTSCADSGNGTLRTAITNANAQPDNTRVTFNLPSSCSGTITLATALPRIAASIDIQGPDASKLTVDGRALTSIDFDFNDYIFDVNELATTFNVSGLTLKGAGIRHVVDVSRSPITDVIDGIVINQADRVDTILTFTGNAGSKATIENSTISDNHSAGEVGVRWMLVNYQSELTFKNNTVVNNSFAESMITSSGTEAAVVQSNTIVNNATGTGGWGEMSFYGVSLFGNIIANLDTHGFDTCAQVLDKGANLFDAQPTGCLPLQPVGQPAATLPTVPQADGSSAVIANLRNTLSSSLALNSGSTPSLKLLPGSPALNYYQANDSGIHGTLLTTDQRGLARPSGSGYDVGAFENQESTCTTANLGVVRFNKNSAKLTKAGKKTLDKYVSSIVASGCRTVTLNGYSAAIGDTTKAKTKFRKNLSKKRAVAVQKYVKSALATHNVSATFVVQGLGAKNPVASNKRESGQKKNRRVEIVISKLRALN